MTVVVRHPRQARMAPLPRTRMLDRPPAPPDPTPAGGVLQVILPALGGLGMVLFMIAGGNPLLLVAGLVMLVVTLGGAIGMAVSTRFGSRRRLADARERYLRHLDEVRSEIRAEAAAQRQHDDDLHPDPSALFGRILGGRVCARRAHDPAARKMRIGVGSTPHPVTVSLPDAPTDPVTKRAMNAVARAHRVLTASPVLIDLADGPILVRGELEEARAAVRALVLQIAAAHPSHRLRIHILTSTPHAYTWARWLPHVSGDGQCRIGPDIVGAVESPDVADDGTPVLSRVVVIDGAASGATPPRGTVHIVLGGDATSLRHHVQILIDGGSFRLIDATGAARGVGTVDAIGAPMAETMARALLSGAGLIESAETSTTGPLPPARVLGVDRLERFDPVESWRPKDLADLLTVAVGRDANGRELRLDLKESGHGGTGPHGLVVGATGSGKSELLRSIVLGLAATHHPDDLAFVLVDYKGGATFSGLESLPHVAGVVTNLSEELGLVDRMHTALLGEIRRRQQVLHDAGHLNDIYAYRERRQRSVQNGDPVPEPLPHLLVVIDEFAELLTAMPDMLELFTTIGRIGRSIGVHQMLASQRLDDGRLRGLESFLSYRFALRTFTAEESRSVIGSTVAAELPTAPGGGYLRTDDLIRFRAAYVSAPEPDVRRDAPAIEVIDWFPAEASPTPASAADRDGSMSVLDAAVARMTGVTPATRRVWLPPLPERITVPELLSTFPDPAPFTARIGIVDLPGEQQVGPLDLDLTRGSCHLAVLGGPDSGRSSTLRTIAYALSLHHGPEELVVHAIDLDGDSFRDLTALPQVGSVAGRKDDDLIRRILGEMLREIDRRTGGGDGDAPHILLLLDGYAALRTNEDLHDQVIAIATRGADAGVHLTLTASRWHDLRPGLQTALHNRLELRLSDPLDSVVDRRLAEHLPTDVPGRALVASGQIAQVCSPGDGVDEEKTYRSLARRHPNRAPQVRLLPSRLSLDELLRGRPHGVADRWWIGVDENDLAPVGVGSDGPHLIVVGDRRSGRTSLLRSIIRQTLADPTAVVALVDPRRTLIDDVPRSRLASYVTTGPGVSEVVHSLVAELDARTFAVSAHPTRPGRDHPDPFSPTVPLASDTPASPAGETARSHIVLVVDDAELVTGTLNPLAPLEPYLAVGDDIGFSLVIARHSGGSARALFDPVLGRIKELGCPGVLLSGDPEEGPLWPAAPLRPLPPGRAVLARRGHRPLLIQLAQP